MLWDLYSAVLTQFMHRAFVSGAGVMEEALVRSWYWFCPEDLAFILFRGWSCPRKGTAVLSVSWAGINLLTSTERPGVM